jgi:large subunit ribosomal protein L29
MAKATKTAAADYRALDDKGLADKISDNELQMKRMQFSHAVNPLENPGTIRSLRRDTARLKTEQTRRAKGF